MTMSCNIHGVTRLEAVVEKDYSWLTIHGERDQRVTVFGLPAEMNATLAYVHQRPDNIFPQLAQKLQQIESAPSANYALELIMHLREHFANLCDQLVNTVLLQEESEVPNLYTE